MFTHAINIGLTVSIVIFGFVFNIVILISHSLWQFKCVLNNENSQNILQEEQIWMRYHKVSRESKIVMKVTSWWSKQSLNIL